MAATLSTNRIQRGGIRNGRSSKSQRVNTARSDGKSSYETRPKNSVSQLPERVPVPGLADLFTGTWNSRETKNISEITMK
jgi:hypothetical protein